MSHPLLAQVRLIKRRARRLELIHALLRLSATVILSGLVVATADCVFRFPDLGWRIVGTAVPLVALVWAGYRFVYPVTRHRITDVAAAQQIERRFPQLSDRLSTAVAFLAPPAQDVQAGSLALRDAAVAEALQTIAATRLERCLDSRATWRAACVLAIVVAVGISLCAANPSAATLALRRMALPLRHEPWPRRNVLTWSKAPRRLAVGADFECALIDANGRLPDRVLLEYRPTDEGPEALQSKPMKILGDKMVGRIDNVSSSFRYRATGGDDHTMDWTTLEVVVPARVIEFSVDLTPPAYTRLPASVSGRHVRAWSGTQLAVRGTLDKPVRSLSLVVNCAGKQQRFTAAINRDGRHFSIPASKQTPWIVQDSGVYWLELRDRQEFASHDLAGSELHIQKDAPPTISLAAPGAGAYFTSQAVVPIRAVAKDDLSIRNVELISGTYQRELFRAPEPDPGSTANPDGAAPQLGETRMVEYDWSLADLPDLNPGDAVEFRLVASDQQLQTGSTAPLRISIISPEELETRLDQRQSSLGQRLREALEIQRTAHDQMQTLQAKWQSTGLVTLDDADALQAVELGQRRLQQVLSGPADSAATLVQLLLEELRSNRVERPQLSSRLTQLQAAIRQINDELAARIQFELTRGLKESKTALEDATRPDATAPTAPQPTASYGGPLQESTTTAETLQVEVITRLEDVLDSLAVWEDYRRLAQDAATLRQRQDGVFQGTQSLSSTGQDVAALSAEQRASLKRLSRRQLDLAREFDRLQSRLTGEHAEPSESDPLGSAVMRQGIEALRQRNLSGQMRQSAQHIDANQVGQAAQVQQSVLTGLSDLLDVLARRGRPDSPQTAREAMAEQLQGLRQLVADWLARQQALTERTPSQLATPPETSQELSRQQQQLSEELLGAVSGTALPTTFQFGIQRAARPMQEAARLLAQNAAAEAVHSPQRLAMQRLEAVQNSLAAPPPTESTTPPPESPTGPQPARTGKVGLAELLLLRSLQTEINERTAAMALLEQPPELLPAEQQAAILELAEDQARLVQILEPLLASESEDADSTPRTAPADPDAELDKALEAAGVPGFSGP